MSVAGKIFLGTRIVNRRGTGKTEIIVLLVKNSLCDPSVLCEKKSADCANDTEKLIHFEL